MPTRFHATLLLVVSAGLCACQGFGPTAVRTGRQNYNEAIHETSKTQVFLNLLRVHNHDTTFFLEITEVDAQLQFGGSISGNATGLGTAFNSKAGGPAEGAAGSLSYSDSPTIRYQPLQGQALVAQISTPINVNSLASLYDSDWPIGAVLDMAVDRMAPRFEDYYSALNAVMELDNYGALVVAQGRSEFTDEVPAPATVAAPFLPMATVGPPDALVLYVEPDHIDSYPGESDAQSEQRVKKLWIRLLELYSKTQVPCWTESQIAAVKAAGDSLKDKADIADQDWRRLPRRLELRTSALSATRIPAGKEEVYDVAPVLRTRSALGVLRAAAQEGGFAEFVTADQYRALLKEPWNASIKTRAEPAYFYLLKSADTRPAGVALNQWLSKTDRLTIHDLHEDVESPEGRLSETKLGRLRRYLLIIEGDPLPPPNAFVSAFYKNKWYYIAGEDTISQQNFALIAQLLMMQAVPQGPPLTPAITIGGH